MPLHWLQMDFNRWRAEQEIALSRLDDVEGDIDRDGYAYIKGKLSWLSASGHRYGPFIVRFVYPHDFPQRRQVPSIYLDGRPPDWRPAIDGHVYADWQICLFIPIESGIDFEQPDSLGKLIELLPPFLTRQRIFQERLKAWRSGKGGRPVWPGPGRAHGVEGYVQALRAHGDIGDDDWCLCGSGRRFVECCQGRIERAGAERKALVAR